LAETSLVARAAKKKAIGTNIEAITAATAR
jgi:hypothetical protein